MKNKMITMYGLMGLIKDDKAPKKICYQGNYLEFDGEDYKFYKGADTVSDDSLVKYIAVGNLKDTVEILTEENDEQHIEMQFPDTFEEFIKSYSFLDDKEIYTNGCELIPTFRLKQWIEHKKEENDEWEDIEEINNSADDTLFVMECYTGIPEKAQDWNFNILENKINQLIKNQKYLKERLDKDEQK